MHYLLDMHMPPSPVARRPARATGPIRGFTLLEVMVVLVLLGIMALVARPLVTDLGEDEATTIALLKVRLRYAQMRSLNNVSVHGVRCTGGSYWLFNDGDLTSHELFPGASSDTITLPSGVSVTSFTVSFDSRGVPYTDAAATAGSELDSSSAAASITVGSQAGAVRVTPNTGYVPD